MPFSFLEEVGPTQQYSAFYFINVSFSKKNSSFIFQSERENCHLWQGTIAQYE